MFVSSADAWEIYSVDGRVLPFSRSNEGGCAARLVSSYDMRSIRQHQRPGDLGDALGMCPAIRPRQAGPCSRISPIIALGNPTSPTSTAHRIPGERFRDTLGCVRNIPPIRSPRPTRCGGGPRPSHAGRSRGAGGRAARQKREARQFRARERAFHRPIGAPRPIGAGAPTARDTGPRSKAGRVTAPSAS